MPKDRVTLLQWMFFIWMICKYGEMFVGDGIFVVL